MILTIAAVLAIAYFIPRIPRKWLFWIAVGFVIAWVPSDLAILPVLLIAVIPWAKIAWMLPIIIGIGFYILAMIVSKEKPVAPVQVKSITSEEFNNNPSLVEARRELEICYEGGKAPFCLMPTNKLSS